MPLTVFYQKTYVWNINACYHGYQLVNVHGFISFQSSVMLPKFCKEVDLIYAESILECPASLGHFGSTSTFYSDIGDFTNLAYNGF